MKKLVFADGWQLYFARFGLRSFEDFFSFEADEKILNASKRYVNCVTLGEAAERKILYIKRFRYSHFKDILFSLYNFGCPCSQAECEWRNANFLIDKGFGTYKPVCYGEQTTCGIEKKSFFVTEKVQGPSLTEFVAQNFSKLEQAEKEKIVADLGRFIRQIHNAQISMPDLYLWHIFLQKKSEGEYDFAIIDLHRMKQGVKSINEQIRNLGRLDYSLREEYFDKKLRRLLIESYAGDNWHGDVNRLALKVRKYSDTISARRNPKPY